MAKSKSKLSPEQQAEQQMERDVQASIDAQPCMKSSSGFSERTAMEIASNVLGGILAGYDMRLEEINAADEEAAEAFDDEEE